MDIKDSFNCTRRNPNNINYNHILRGTFIDQRNATNYINEIQLVVNIKPCDPVL